jgi:hypothetical protein
MRLPTWQDLFNISRGAAVCKKPEFSNPRLRSSGDSGSIALGSGSRLLADDLELPQYPNRREMPSLHFHE